MSRTTTREVETPVGTARVTTYEAVLAQGQGAPLTLVLGHGAGGGIGARDLVALARALPPRGVTVALVEQPWRVAGRKVAVAPPQLDRAWTAVLTDPALAGPARDPVPSTARRIVVGGRSAGARVACRTATAVGAVAVVALAFPLHPPGRPERSRADELLGAGVPTLVVQGERDAFGGAGQIPSGPLVVPIPYADHSFGVPKAATLTQAAALALLVEAVGTFLDGLG